MLLVALVSVNALALPAGAQERGTITWDHFCFTINGQDTALYSGSIHYFRCAPGMWRDELVKAKAAGFNTIATYIPWNYHEPIRGQVDLSELEDFIDLCDEVGLYFIARPGPYICSEWDNAAYPDWLPATGVTNAALRNHDNPRHVEQVRQWYAVVADVLRPRLVTNGGNVVAVQIENEYHFGVHYKVQVIRDLYKMVRDLGIDVPIVTCYTPFAWDNDDPIMADIIDGNNSGQARWSNIEGIERAAAQSRREENNGPTICMENPMGQGNFTNFTGNTARPLTANDFTVVNKTIWGEGGGLTNYYMLYGGTNFAYWGSDYQSTTYASRQPVSCPIDEPGGLLDSYYEVKLIGQWLGSFGPSLVRAVPAEGTRIVDCDADKQPRLTYRVNGDQAFFFVREAEDKPQQLRLAYADPRTGEQLTIPAGGRITLPPQGMIILTANVPLHNALLKYSTSEVLRVGLNGGNDVLVVYGPTGSEGEIALAFGEKPTVVGATSETWDQAAKTLILGYEHQAEPQFVRAGKVSVVIVDRAAAMTTWCAPLTKNGGGQGDDGDSIEFVTNAYLLADVQPGDNGVAFEVQSRPGETQLNAFVAKKPAAVEVDGRAVPFEYDEAAGKLSLGFSTPENSFREIVFDQARFRDEDFTAGDAWGPISLTSGLEEQNIIGKGYVRYTATFDPGDAVSMILRLYIGSARYDGPSLGDAVMVFINGKYVHEVSGFWVHRKRAFPLKDYAKSGSNRIDVVLERRPRPRGGAGMCQPKGLAAASLIGPGHAPWQREVTDWSFTVGLQGQQDGCHLPDFDDSKWGRIDLGDWKKQLPRLKEYVGVGWYRMDFTLNEPADWVRPLHVSLDVVNDALIYLNGRLIGRYHEMDWQRDFYMPASWLNLNGKNALAIAVRNDPREAGQDPPARAGLLKASVGEYQPYSVRKSRINIRF